MILTRNVFVFALIVILGLSAIIAPFLLSSKVSQQDLQLQDGSDVGQWNIQRSASDDCWSRSEAHLYYKNKDPWQLTPELEKAINNYLIMHKRCTDPKIVEKYLHSSTPEGAGEPPCRYVFHKGSGGLGNRLQGLMSTFLFSLLTNRALLVALDDLSDEPLLCQPFSWYLSPEHQKSALEGLDGLRMTVPGIEKDLEEGKTTHKASLYTRFDAQGDDAHFFCQHGQLILQNVTWLLMPHARWFTAPFSVIPMFRKELERLFPDRIVFSRVARFLLHPNNRQWDRITRAYHSHIRGADTVIGVQVRTFHSQDEWASPRVLDCLTNVTNVLPPPIGKEQWLDMLTNKSHRAAFTKAVETREKAKSIKIYLATMHDHITQWFRQLYEEGIADDGTIVSIHTETNVGYEQWTVEQHSLALQDIWLLSFSDILFTSAHSTFGYLAAGLAGIRPYILNIAHHEYGFEGDMDSSWMTNGRPVCVLSPSLEPCSVPAPNRPCASEESKDAPPYLKRSCPSDLTAYWQVITDHKD